MLSFPIVWINIPCHFGSFILIQCQGQYWNQAQVSLQHCQLCPSRSHTAGLRWPSSWVRLRHSWPGPLEVMGRSCALMWPPFGCAQARVPTSSTYFSPSPLFPWWPTTWNPLGQLRNAGRVIGATVTCWGMSEFGYMGVSGEVLLRGGVRLDSPWLCIGLTPVESDLSVKVNTNDIPPVF